MVEHWYTCQDRIREVQLKVSWEGIAVAAPGATCATEMRRTPSLDTAVP